MKRLFFALPVPEENKRQILHSFPLKIYPGIRWVGESNLHITVHFMGSTPEERMTEIIQKGTNIFYTISPFELQGDSFKVVIKERKPTMIWSQYEPNNEFESLCYALREAFPTIEKRTPLPHLTVARIKQLRKLPFDLPKIKPLPFIAEKVELWESHLARAGAEYELVETWKFGDR